MGHRLHSVQEQRDRRRRLLTWALSCGLCVLLVNSLIGENGYLATLRAQGERDALSAVVARLRIENQRTLDESRRLKTDPSALEEAARRSLNLIKPGETLVIIKDVAPSGSSGSSR
jgi:cell division protein FtsB